MYKLVLLIVWLSMTDVAHENTITHGPWSLEECKSRFTAYINMHNSMPGRAVISADCVLVEEKEEGV